MARCDPRRCARLLRCLRPGTFSDRVLREQLVRRTAADYSMDRGVGALSDPGCDEPVARGGWLRRNHDLISARGGARSVFSVTVDAIGSPRANLSLDSQYHQPTASNPYT